MIKNLLILFISLSITACTYNPFYNNFKGKKLYTLAVNTSIHRVIGISVHNTAVTEVELYFQSDKEVSLAVKTIYISIGADLIKRENFPPPITYSYTYENGFLNIPELGLKEVKLENHPEFYSTSDGEVFYKRSISEISEDKKKDRLLKVTKLTIDDIESLYKSERVF